MTTRIRIEYDECTESPRQWDNLGTFVCTHSRYTLGDDGAELPTLDLLTDEQCETLARELVGDAITREEWRAERAYYGGSVADTFRDYYDDPQEYHPRIWEEIETLAAVILPVYIYDHSGITLNTSGFACGWDSGQCGVIWVSHERIREEYGSVTPESIERATACLVGEIKTLDQYVTGQVYGFIIETDDPETDGKHDDSCWGFYASYRDDGLGGMIDHLPGWSHEAAREAMENTGKWVDIPNAPKAPDTVAI